MPNLSDDLLLAIFESIVHHKSTEAYPDLTNVALVCKAWALPATQVLLSYVEVVLQEDGEALVQCLQTQNKGTLVKTLVLGFRLDTHPDLGDVICRTTFYQILNLTRHVRKIVFFPFSSRESHFHPQRPHLPFLEDVIVAQVGLPLERCGRREDQARVQGGIVGILPNHVRFLTLIDAPMILPTGTFPHSLQLYGLGVPQYPTPLTDCVLARSKTTLQSLTTGHVASVPFLSFHHPNLRSLKILSSMEDDPSTFDFRFLERLERLEIRALAVPANLARVLPKSLQYLRFWSTGLAESLVEVLQEDDLESLLPALHTIVWDWWIYADSPPLSHWMLAPLDKKVEIEKLKEASPQLRDRLEMLCLDRGIQLKMAMRRNGGWSPGLDQDFEYESSFRQSCFTAGMGLTSRTTGHIPASSMTTALPIRIISQTQKRRFTLPWVLSYEDTTYERPKAALWDECFEGRVKWVKNSRAEQRRYWAERERLDALERPKSTLMGPRWPVKRAVGAVRSWFARSARVAEAK